jgi:hypothetical protein
MVHPGRNAAIRPRSSDGEETVSRESGQRTARSQSQLLQLCETWKGPDVWQQRMENRGSFMGQKSSQSEESQARESNAGRRSWGDELVVLAFAADRAGARSPVGGRGSSLLTRVVGQMGVGDGNGAPGPG